MNAREGEGRKQTSATACKERRISHFFHHSCNRPQSGWYGITPQMTDMHFCPLLLFAAIKGLQQFVFTPLSHSKSLIFTWSSSDPSPILNLTAPFPPLDPLFSCGLTFAITTNMATTVSCVAPPREGQTAGGCKYSRHCSGETCNQRGVTRGYGGVFPAPTLVKPGATCNRRGVTHI